MVGMPGPAGLCPPYAQLHVSARSRAVSVTPVKTGVQTYLPGIPGVSYLGIPSIVTTGLDEGGIGVQGARLESISVTWEGIGSRAFTP